MTEPSAPYTRGLHELSRGDDAGFGGKSASLGALLSAGIPVPPGFALSIGAFADFMAAAGLAPSAGPADADALGAAIVAAPVPDAIRGEIAERYGELGAAVGDEAPPVAVRSSALGEDGADATFAGQQDTILWVRGVDDIRDAVRRCWGSLYSREAVSYRQRLGPSAAPAMGVAVQLMVEAAVSGVMFTCNPISGDPSMVAINASWGLGVAVVGGEVTPDDHLVSKVTGEVVRRTIADKAIEYVPAEHGTQRIEVDGERRREPCLDDGAIAALVGLGRRIEGLFGGPQDIEWAIDHAGELFVLQSRPVTGLPERAGVPAAASALSLVMGRFGAGG